MKGRKRLPTAIKIVTGNRGRKPLPKDEPMPPGNLLAAPEWLNKSQCEAWDYAIRNSPPGLLRRLDRSVLTTFVVAESLHREAAMELAKHGAVIYRRKTKTAVQAPHMLILNRQAAVMLRAAEQLGFSPASRARITYSGAPDQGPSDPSEKFFDDGPQRFFGDAPTPAEPFEVNDADHDQV